MNALSRPVALLLVFAPLAALALLPAQQQPADLTVLSADEWEIEGEALVMWAEVANLADSVSPECEVRLFAWGASVGETVPPLDYDESVVIEFRLPVPLEVAGTTQEVLVEVDPEGQIAESNRDNNVYVTRIEVPGQAGGAESELFIEGVSPGEVIGGEVFTLEVSGRGFEAGAEVFIEDVEVSGVTRVDDASLVVEGVVSEDAAPGPRRVEVVNPDGARASLPGGLEVVGGAPGPEPGPGPTPDFLRPVLIGGGIVLLLVAGGAALVAGTTGQPGKKALQEQAQEQEPPDECAPGSQWVRKVKPSMEGIEPHLWQVGDLRVALYDATRQAAGEGHEASRKVVGGLNKAIQARRLRPNDEDRFAQALQAAAEELAAQIIGWQALVEQGRDVSLDARLEGPEVEVGFEVYRCKGQPGSSHWEKEREWTAKVRVTDERHAGTLWGPRADEGQDAYMERARQEVAARLRALAESVVGS